jgi:hypothetical protein
MEKKHKQVCPDRRWICRQAFDRGLILPLSRNINKLEVDGLMRVRAVIASNGEQTKDTWTDG